MINASHVWLISIILFVICVISGSVEGSALFFGSSVILALYFVITWLINISQKLEIIAIFLAKLIKNENNESEIKDE